MILDQCLNMCGMIHHGSIIGMEFQRPGRRDSHLSSRCYTQDFGMSSRSNGTMEAGDSARQD